MEDLYHPRILELAANIPHVGRLDQPDGAATKVSRVCGSVVTVELKLKDGIVSDIAVHPKACALGQAATGVLAMNAIGATPQEIRAARDGLQAMLKDGAEPPAGRFGNCVICKVFAITRRGMPRPCWRSRPRSKRWNKPRRKLICSGRRGKVRDFASAGR
jgi:NifU-like protein involved in Fe-S cluster formation